MKTLIVNSIVALSLLSCINISAQFVATKKSLCDELMKNSYIFEGKIISKHDGKTRGDLQINSFKTYTSYLVEVDKVVKGNIQKGTINIIMPTVISFDHEFIVPGEGLYICDDSPVKDSSVVNTNSKSLEYDCGESMSNGELKKDNNDVLIQYFPSLADFYSYLNANYGMNIESTEKK